jgi:proteasome lid subunit RPN8/RPN11
MLRGDYLTPDLVDALQRHAIDAYPHEALGVVTPDGYRRMENKAEDPGAHGVYDRDVMQGLMANGELLAIAHSHPNGPNCPSKADAMLQERLAVPGILVCTNGDGCMSPTVWGDMFTPDPLERRGFQYQVTDCFELIRDWYLLETGKRPPRAARDWLWWTDPAAPRMVDVLFKPSGFVQIEECDAARGSVLVVMTGRKAVAPTHGLLYLGDGLVLNHSTATKAYDPSRLSRTEPLTRWLPYKAMWLHPDANSQTLWQPRGEVRR